MGFVGVDAVVVRVPHLDEGLRFYRDVLGHELIWRREDAAALRMRDSPTELVLMTGVDAETDLIVEDLGMTIATITGAGGRTLVEPFALDVGRCAVVADPFGNRLTLIELSAGRYVTADDGSVIGVQARDAQIRDVQITVRRGQPSDLHRLQPFWVEVHGHHRRVMPHLAPYVDDARSWREREQLYRDLLGKPGTVLLLAEERETGTLVGYGLSHVVSAGETWLADTWQTGGLIGEVESLAVAEQHRGRGIGSHPLELLLNDLRSREVSDVIIGVLPGNDKAVALYRRYGFRPVWSYLARLDGRVGDDSARDLGSTLSPRSSDSSREVP